MKLFFLSVRAAMVASMIFLFACEKKQDIHPAIQPEQKQDVAVKDGRLVFKDRSSFERHSTALSKLPEKLSLEIYLNSVEQRLGFVSMRSMLDPLAGIANARTKSEENCIEDDYLASMLSPEGIVQIDEYIYRIDACNERVYALKAEDEALISELKKELPAHEKITVFSTSDEVLNLVEAGEQGDATARVNFLCTRESGAAGKKAEAPREYASGTYVYIADIKHVYQKAGVYFSLMTEMKYQRSDPQKVFLEQFSTQISYQIQFKYRKKCDNTERFSALPYETATVNDNKLTRRMYESTTALHKYMLSSTYIYERKDLAGPTPTFDTVIVPTIQDNY